MGNAAWSKLTENSRIPDSLKVVFVSVLGAILGFWGTNLCYYTIWKMNWLSRYKIQGMKMPAQELINKELKENVFALITGIPFTTFIFYKLLTLGKSKSTANLQNEERSSDDKPQKRGWANVRIRGKVPPVLEQILQIIIAYLIYDFAFYCMHRTLHHPKLFMKIHRDHHKFKTPIGISASYAQFFENLAQIIIWWIPIGISGWLRGDLHISTIFWYTIFRWIETVEAHSGYEIPFHPIRLFILPAGARFHDFHHSHFDGNYGASKIWDWVLGTNRTYLSHIKQK